MIFKSVLIIIFLLMITLSLYQFSENRFFRCLIILISSIGLLSVLFPNRTTLIANLLNIGRGADLVLYSWVIVSFLFLSLFGSNLLRIKRDTTLIVRKLAILSARKNIKNPKEHLS